MRQRGSWSEAYSGENGCHPIPAEELPCPVLLEQGHKGMSVWQDDRVRVALRDDRRPALGHIADAQVAAEEGRSIDFHPTVDEDAAAVRVKAPQQVAAVVVVVEDADRFPESLERIRRLHRKDGGAGGRFLCQAG